MGFSFYVSVDVLLAFCACRSVDVILAYIMSIHYPVFCMHDSNNRPGRSTIGDHTAHGPRAQILVGSYY